jgi:acyl-[acyl-carrier-protein]-phospholipid O-acyltransferase/long-chain-fatty-acid--[acyl-carrier-protein] ligase
MQGKKSSFQKIFGEFFLKIFRVRASYRSEFLKSLKNGPAIVVANHISFLDGLIVAFASPVSLYFGVDPAFSRHSFLGKFFLKTFSIFGFWNFVPLDSSSPFGMRTLLRVLQSGQSIMLFPEGAISPTCRPLPEQPGVKWLKQKTGASILRIHITGAEKSRFFGKSGRSIWPKIYLSFQGETQ